MFRKDTIVFDRQRYVLIRDQMSQSRSHFVLKPGLGHEDSNENRFFKISDFKQRNARFIRGLSEFWHNGKHQNSFNIISSYTGNVFNHFEQIMLLQRDGPCPGCPTGKCHL